MSDCVFEPGGKRGEKFVYVCMTCHRDVAVRREGVKIRRECRSGPLPVPAHGPGTEIHAMISQLGFSSAGCGGCQGAIDQMNRWGVMGCREPANRAWIIDQLSKSAARLGWAEKLAAGVAAARQGLPLTIPGLVDEAIRRAEAKTPAATEPSAPAPLPPRA